MIRICVVVAAFRMSGVRQVIEDLDAQTYKDFDVVIVNDGQEEVRNGIKDIIKDRSRYYFIDIPICLGKYGACSRNIGSVFAFNYISQKHRVESEEFIMFADDDNRWHPEFLERLAKLHNENPDAVLLGTDFEIRGKRNKEYRHTLRTVISPQNLDLGCFLYNRDAFINCGMFQANARYKISYDYQLVKRMAEAHEGKVAILHGEPLFYYYHSRR